MNDERWTPRDIIHLSVLIVALCVIGAAIWYGQSGDWKNTPTLASYIQKAYPGAYFVRDGNCQVAMDSSGQTTGVATCGRSVEAVISPANIAQVKKIVTDLSGMKAWKWATEVIASQLPEEIPAPTAIFGNTQIRIEFNSTTQEFVLLDTR